ncbi:unnamed protein product [Mytilus edulis]|uniref:Farnesoic acid O-methyl transferase domain-containing protein n=1 Tax=Mytilus edulis TaxID=6550 RepID=A0A8S3SP59_MYTED|nr:unnamed protein product [Mytilus edulis]
MIYSTVCHQNKTVGIEVPNGFNCCSTSSTVVFALTQSLDIFTKNSGQVDTRITKDVYKYYTNLASYGITPGLNDQLEFKVRACADTSVLLSDAHDLISTDHYDVVLDGFNNGWSEIRKRGVGQITVETPQILSCKEFRKFTIRWSDDGVIEVQNSSTVFMRLVEDSKISVLGLGIMTSHGSIGNWTFTTFKGIYCFILDKEKIENGNKENPGLCEPCICTNQTQTQNFSYTEWREILAPQLEQIKNNMKLDKKRLSSTIRKRTCASDYRPSAQRLGIIGAGFIVVEIFHYITCAASIIVRKPDSGYVNSVDTSNITDYYTMLGRYGILPEPNGHLSNKFSTSMFKTVSSTAAVSPLTRLIGISPTTAISKTLNYKMITMPTPKNIPSTSRTATTSHVSTNPKSSIIFTLSNFPKTATYNITTPVSIDKSTS